MRKNTIRNFLRIAVVGNRTGWDEKYVKSKLKSFFLEADEIISGGAEGVDTFAQNFAKENGFKITIFYPNPKVPSPQRYYARNQDIVDYSDMLIAFQNNPHRSGTQSSINRAKKRGIPTVVVTK